MKRTLIVATTIVMLLAPAVHCGEGKGDEKMMEGTWVPVSAEMAGQKMPDEALKSMKLVLKGDKYAVTVADQLDQGTCKLDSTKKPKWLDITGTEGPNKGKTYLCIYEFSQDSLKVCYDLSGTSRPSEFKTAADTQLFLVNYKRQKP